ncbi:MAG: DPP IV N-terminal domain-containing protein, partial [Nodosilinea sp.]
MIYRSAVVLTTGLMTFGLAAAQAADLSFATPEGLFRLGEAEERQPLVVSTDRAVSAMDWSSDGRRLAVVQNYGEVYRLDSDADTPELVFTSTCQSSPTLDLVWQNDGDLVILQRCPSSSAEAMDSVELFLSTPAGALTPLNILPGSLESDAYLAPDGSQVAYVTGQHIFVAALDGSRPQRLTQTPGTYGAAGSPLAWSPDGTRLAFYEGSYPFQTLN